MSAKITITTDIISNIISLAIPFANYFATALATAFALLSIVCSIVFNAAWAFDVSECMTRSMQEPYAMGDDEARSACEAKNTQTGVGNIPRVWENLPLKTDIWSKDSYSYAFKRHLNKGELKVKICLGSCPGGYPACPSGYEVVEESANAMGNGGYHGRYRIRSTACLKN